MEDTNNYYSTMYILSTLTNDQRVCLVHAKIGSLVEIGTM